MTETDLSTKLKATKDHFRKKSNFNLEELREMMVEQDSKVKTSFHGSNYGKYN